MHALMKCVIIGPGNGLNPFRRQAFTRIINNFRSNAHEEQTEVKFESKYKIII